MCRLLSEIGRRTADLGVPLGYHNHMRNLGQSPDEVARVLDAADARYVKLELDTAHWQAAGGDPVEAIRRHGDRLLFLHLKDLERPAPGGAPDSFRFVELGRGAVNCRAVLAELRRIEFDGWAIVELDRVPEPTRTPKQCAEVSKRHLESLGYLV
jgi:inosose dehydratase